MAIQYFFFVDISFIIIKYWPIYITKEAIGHANIPIRQNSCYSLFFFCLVLSPKK